MVSVSGLALEPDICSTLSTKCGTQTLNTLHPNPQTVGHKAGTLAGLGNVWLPPVRQSVVRRASEANVTCPETLTRQSTAGLCNVSLPLVRQNVICRTSEANVEILNPKPEGCVGVEPVLFF